MKKQLYLTHVQKTTLYLFKSDGTGKYTQSLLILFCQKYFSLQSWNNRHKKLSRCNPLPFAQLGYICHFMTYITDWHLSLYPGTCSMLHKVNLLKLNLLLFDCVKYSFTSQLPNLLQVEILLNGWPGAKLVLVLNS